ncbi:MAG: TolC family protein, partial [Acidobacteria bacterium]|nr:TolC family protein [Acidobacteriota bacterium]
MSRIHSYFRFILSTAFLFFILQTLYAQSPPPPPKTLTLDQAVNLALANYPAIRAAQESATAAHAGVSLAKTAYLPRTDLLWQANRASRNNVFGLLLPQSVIPSVSGPVLTSTSNQGVWGSAAGMLLSWEPFDFGYRRATVSAAQANEGIANANTAITRLDVAIAAAGNFLAVLAAQERVRAVRADLERREVFARAIHALVDNQLRPGADASRADAELAGARIRVIQAETAVEESRATLAAILGFAG